MHAAWWCIVNTLRFSAEQFIKPDVLKEPLDWFQREVGVSESSKLFLNVVLLNIAMQAVATVWCRRGENFAVGWIDNDKILRTSCAILRRFGITPDLEQHVAYRMCLGLTMLDTCVDWRWLFTVYQQWYDGQVAFAKSDLRKELERLSVVIHSPTIPGLSCTFNPWALVFDNGEPTFTNK